MGCINLLSRIDFTFLTRTTGLAISNAIKESLCTYNIDISGQAYDGTSAMSSNIQVFKLAFAKLHHWPFTPIVEAMFLI